MNFKDFKKDVESAFNAMIADNLFVVNVDKDLLWMSYLLSFEDETIRQDHNWQIAELMSINLLTFVCSLNKLTVFNFEFNTYTVIIVS